MFTNPEIFDVQEDRTIYKDLDILKNSKDNKTFIGQGLEAIGADETGIDPHLLKYLDSRFEMVH